MSAERANPVEELRDLQIKMRKLWNRWQKAEEVEDWPEADKHKKAFEDLEPAERELLKVVKAIKEMA
jgi:hypothetical protein